MTIPESQTHIGSFSIINNKLKLQLEAILTDPIRDDEIEPFKDVKRLYRSCMNTELIESRGLAPVKRVIDAMGGWPMVDGTAWDKEGNWTWQKAMKASNENGYPVYYMFVFGITVDEKNTSRRTLLVSQNAHIQQI